MGDLLQFQSHRCRAPRRGRRRKGAPTAQVLIVPSSRHRNIVDYIAAQMKGKQSLDAAEDYLISHLEIEWSRLADLGLNDVEIERHCDLFARAAWRVVLAGRETEGVA